MKNYEIDLDGRMIKIKHVPLDFFDDCRAKTDGDTIWMEKQEDDRLYLQDFIHELYEILFPDKPHNLITLESQSLAEALYLNGMLIKKE